MLEQANQSARINQGRVLYNIHLWFCINITCGKQIGIPPRTAFGGLKIACIFVHYTILIWSRNISKREINLQISHLFMIYMVIQELLMVELSTAEWFNNS